ncbi:MAG: S-adenosylmethionine:tRNA ribosyltransferase-isomerase [Flavisolibacter sp.]|jgi:S-adenosylmethionine:tRNA ribosyltransferase-isomerase|nr:S-adenosylmethionine:tRNA ribosyltransferase-isomerase [Flavisolibacter sp.]
MSPDNIFIKDYTYFLPADRIASHPLPQRDASKLLVYKSGKIKDERFYNLPDELPADSLLVLNNTKVIEARILFQKKSGGIIEIFCLEPVGQNMETALQQTATMQWKCLVGGASKWKAGQILKKQLSINGKEVELQGSYKEKLDDGFIIRFDWSPVELHFAEVLHAAGEIPLPPYIKRSAETIDTERYQTIFGKHDGSVAAPTAALHFTAEIFKQLQQKRIDTTFITLNVGAGTFKPVKTETIAEHSMHGEDFTITKEVLEKIMAAKKIIAVGTTSLRTIESIYWLGVKLVKGLLQNNWALEQWEAYALDNSINYEESIKAILHWMDEHSITELHCRTSMLIVPGYTFKMPVGLITNFHQPQSTLLLLVAAFIGNDWKKVYKHAMENDYRFLSYGDSSYLSLG